MSGRTIWIPRGTGVGDGWREEKLSFINGATLYQGRFLDFYIHSNTNFTKQFMTMYWYACFTDKNFFDTLNHIEPALCDSETLFSMSFVNSGFRHLIWFEREGKDTRRAKIQK